MLGWRVCFSVNARWHCWVPGTTVHRPPPKAEPWIACFEIVWLYGWPVRTDLAVWTRYWVAKLEVIFFHANLRTRLPQGLLTVFDLLAISGRFLQSLDDKGCCTGKNRNLCLTILDCQLNSHFESLPVLGCLGNVISNFFGRLDKASTSNCHQKYIIDTSI